MEINEDIQDRLPLPITYYFETETERNDIAAYPAANDNNQDMVKRLACQIQKIPCKMPHLSWIFKKPTSIQVVT